MITGILCISRLFTNLVLLSPFEGYDKSQPQLVQNLSLWEPGELCDRGSEPLSQHKAGCVTVRANKVVQHLTYHDKLPRYLVQHCRMESSTRPKQSKSSVSCLRTSTLVLNVGSPSTASKLTLRF